MTRIARHVPAGLAWGALAVVCVVPVAFAAASLLRLEAWPRFDERSVRLLMNSFGVSGGASIAACLLGVPAGFAVSRAGSRGERALACLVAASFLIPPYVAAVAWIDLTGAGGWVASAPGLIYSVGGAAWVLGASYLAIPAAAVVLAARSGAFAGVAPARQTRGSLAILSHVLVPAVRPYGVGAAALVFLIAFAEFSVPSLLQVAVYPVEIHTRFASDYDVPSAIAASMPVVLTGFVVLIAVAMYLRRAARPLGELATADSRVGLPRALRNAFTTVACGALSVAVLLPMAALVRRAESFAALREAWTTAGPEIQSSAELGAVTATLAVVVAFLLAGHSSAKPFRLFAAGLAALTFLMPGPAIGIALIEAWNHADWRASVYDGPPILVLACAARLLAVGIVVIAVSRVSQAREWEEAARVAGVPSWRRQLWIALPASAPSLVAAWAVVFVMSSREADASLLVAPPGATTLAVRLIALMHYGPSAVVAGLALLMIGLGLASALGLSGFVWGLNRWLHGPPLRS